MVDIQSIDDSRNVTKNCQQNTDQKISTTSALGRVSKRVHWHQDLFAHTSRKTPSGGRMTAKMILQISLCKVSFVYGDRVLNSIVMAQFARHVADSFGAQTYLAVKGILIDWYVETGDV
jgi:hypothetical protein